MDGPARVTGARDVSQLSRATGVRRGRIAKSMSFGGEVITRDAPSFRGSAVAGSSSRRSPRRERASAIPQESPKGVRQCHPAGAPEGGECRDRPVYARDAGADCGSSWRGTSALAFTRRRGGDGESGCLAPGRWWPWRFTRRRGGAETLLMARRSGRRRGRPSPSSFLGLWLWQDRYAHRRDGRAAKAPPTSFPQPTVQHQKKALATEPGFSPRLRVSA